MAHHRSIARCIVFLALIAPACGGTVVVDGEPESSGGVGGGPGSTGPGTTGPGTGAGGTSVGSTGSGSTGAGAGGGSETTLNPDDKSENILLVNGNLTAIAMIGAFNDSVRATASKQTGKGYFEVLVESSGQEFFSLGVADQDEYLVLGPGSTSNGCGYEASGFIDCNGETYVTAPTYTIGDIIGIAVDMDAHRVYFNMDGFWVAGPPEEGGGFYLGQTPMFPMVNLSEKGQVTVNFGASPFALPVPNDYPAGW